jgi:hypothetical protein
LVFAYRIIDAARVDYIAKHDLTGL